LPITLGEGIKNEVLIGLRNANSCVSYGNAQADYWVAFRPWQHCTRRFDIHMALLGKFQSIAHQVKQNLAQPHVV
jgi:hypothetical protein